MEAQFRGLIVVPAFNEAESIGKVLDKIRASCSEGFDILVIDDGSEDRTAQVARNKSIEVIVHDKNLGVTAAIQTGRIYALKNHYDFMVTLDADGQHDPFCVNRIIDPLVKGRADFVVGSRELGKYFSNEPLILKMARKISSMLTSFLTRRRITDSTSGFKGWNRKVVQFFMRSIHPLIAYVVVWSMI